MSGYPTVFYDHQAFMQKYGGISRYFCELMRNGHGLFNYSVGGFFADNFYSNKLGIHKPSPIVKRHFKGKGRLLYWINRIDSARKLKEYDKYDIVHPTNYDTYLIGKTDKPIVLTVHDMIHELLASGGSIAAQKKTMMSKASRIIAISENTKKDIMRIYPQIPEDSISVIYLGTSWEILNNAESEGSKYILFTGQRNCYKNFERFVIAVAPLLVKYDLRLRCTGSPFDKYEIDLLKKQNVFDRAGAQFVNEDELKEHYANAICFVFPSVYEGFGIPILEAFACGCPVVLSETSCFPEIAGDAGVFFDPESIEDMRKKIDKVICSGSLRKDLVNRGFERSKAFSWRKCAEQTAIVYESVIL